MHASHNHNKEKYELLISTFSNNVYILVMYVNHQHYHKIKIMIIWHG